MVCGVRLVGTFKQENILSQSSLSCLTMYWDGDKERKHGTCLSESLCERKGGFSSRSCSPKYFTSPKFVAKLPKSLTVSWEMCICISSGTWRSWAQIPPSWGEDICRCWTISTWRREAVLCYNPFQIISFSSVFVSLWGCEGTTLHHGVESLQSFSEKSCFIVNILLVPCLADMAVVIPTIRHWMHLRWWTWSLCAWLKVLRRWPDYDEFGASKLRECCLT